MEGGLGPCLSNVTCNSAPGSGDGLCSRNQDDRDGDDVGDVCDNCGRIGGCGLASNPSQANLDCDRLAIRGGSECDACGDTCDDDRDGDDVPNDDDNCPDHANGDWQQFLDLDEDGVGSLCDFDEREILGGMPMPDPMDIMAGFPGDLTDSLLIPIAPCLADGPGCPDFLSDRFRVMVDIALPVAAMGARIIDDTGAAVAQSDFGAAMRMMAFTPRADSFFRPPAGMGRESGTSRISGGNPSAPIRARQYFLELWAAPGMVPDFSYPFTLSVASDDGVVDAADHAVFVSCLSGPQGGILQPTSLCAVFDKNQDQDVDLRDWAILQIDYTQPMP
jgi:hypothetical protein